MLPEAVGSRERRRIAQFGQGIGAGDEIEAATEGEAAEVMPQQFGIVGQARRNLLGQIEERPVVVEQRLAEPVEMLARGPCGRAGAGAGIEQRGGRKAGSPLLQFRQHAGHGGVGGGHAAEGIGDGVGLIADHRAGGSGTPVLV